MPNWSGYYSLAEAAGALGLSRERVRVLADSGRLPAEQVAGRWLVPPDAVKAYRVTRRRAGRPLSPQTAWEIINDGLIARLLLTADDAGQRNIRVQLASRADVHDVFVLPQLISKVQPHVTPGGRGLAESADVPAGKDLRWELDGYIRRSDFAELMSSRRISDIEGEPNVRLRVLDDGIRPADSRSGNLVVAWLDLADNADRAAEMTLRALRADVRAAGVTPFPVHEEVLAKASLSVLRVLNDELSR